MIQSTAPGMCQTLLQLSKQVYYVGYRYADRRVLQPEHFIDHHVNGNFSLENWYQQVYNLNLAFNHQVTATINQLGPVASEAGLLALVMVEQAIIQAAIPSVETFHGTKHKLKSWTASVENSTQISKQDILQIVFSKMIGPPLTSAHWLRDH